MSALNKRLGSTVRQIRIARGWTQMETAERAGISTSYLALIEQGKRSPNFTMVTAVASALHVPVAIVVYLATGLGEVEKLDPDLAQRLALLAWKVIEQPVVEEEAETP